MIASEMTRISAFLSSCDPSYSNQLHQEIFSNGSSLIKNLVSGSVNLLEEKVFKNDLLKDCLEANLHKTFVMPIYKELSNI
jgi:hypothetical protein